MERSFNWTGLLVEADRESYNLLRSRKRKSWASNACLSSDPFPKEVFRLFPYIWIVVIRFFGLQVSFRSSYALGHIVDEYEPVKNLSGIMSAYGQTITTQCFPLYTMLLALNRTTVDYFSLDVEGYELHVLKTIPFDEIDIQVKLWPRHEFYLNDSTKPFIDAYRCCLSNG